MSNDNTDEFIELVNNVCRRPRMFTLNRTFGEVAAIFTGIEMAGTDTPISQDRQRTLNIFVTSRLLVPDKYWWPGAIRIVTPDDDAAIGKLNELLVQFATLRKTHSLEEIRELAARHTSEYIETEPAKVWKRFLAARYAAEQAQVEPLIMPHPDASVLWRGDPTPPDVAEQLGLISESYVVSVIAGSIESGHVTLITELGRIEAHRIDDSWRIDASPIIAMDIRNAQ